MQNTHTDHLFFANEEPQMTQETLSLPEHCWKLLVIDDEEDIHAVTTLVLRNFQFQDKPLYLLHAKSAEQAKQVLKEHPDIHLALVDVVMETENAGLQCVEYIRHELNNHLIRLLLRTGQPGQAPENKVVQDYDINAYLEKSELSAQKLISAVTTALRSYAELSLQMQQVENLQSQAESGENVKRAFMANISHEIRTPLNAIQGFAETLLQVESHPQQQAAIQIILESSQHLTTLIEDLLTLAELESNPPELKLECFHFPDFLREIIEIHQNLATFANVHLECDIQQPMPKHLCTDTSLLRQVLQCLLNNAIKFSAQKAPGEVALRIRYTDESVQFHIQDNGVGMSERQQQQMLAAFEQGETRGLKNEGLGLGLTLAKKYLDGLHSTLDIDCPPQQGCSCHFHLPLPKEIEWTDGICATLTPQKMPPSMVAPQDRPPAPSKEKVENLYELAMQGYIQDIADEAERLQEWDERFHQFAQDLKQFSENFQKSELCKYLKAYLDA